MAKTVYFSKFGGEVYGILAGSEGDAEYEKTLPAGWKKEVVTDAEAKDKAPGRDKFKADDKGKMGFVGGES